MIGSRYPRLSLERSSRLSSFPLGFFGKLSTKTTRFGTLNDDIRALQCWITDASSRVLPLFTTITAVTASTQYGSGNPTTATSDSS